MIHLYLSSLLVLICSAVCSAEHRVALLIDNSDAKLKTKGMPTLKTALTKLGFRITEKKQLDRDELRSTLDRFVQSIPTRGSSFIYFRGYALQGSHKGTDDSFLMPSRIDSLKSSREIGNIGYGINRLMQSLDQDSGGDTNILVVDACHRHAQQSDSIPLGLMKPKSIPPTVMLCTSAETGKTLPLTSSLVSKLSAEGKLLDALQSNGWATWKSEVELTGEATPVVSPPAKIVEGKKSGDEWVNAYGMVFCWCPSGSFVMGSSKNTPGRNSDEGPVKVTLTKGFWLAKYELTKRENPGRHPRNTISQHKHDPITMIHFDDGRAMTRRYTQAERKAGRLPKEWEYALPTEIEWEYAAKAGSTTKFYFGDEAEKLAKHANFADRSLFDTGDGFYNYAHRSWNDGVAYLAKVGSYPPNAWGVHDMLGNVWEWCDSRYVEKLQGGTDPFKHKGKGNPVMRGGSWVSRAEYCRCAFRRGWPSRAEQNYIGYRFIIRKK